MDPTSPSLPDETATGSPSSVSTSESADPKASAESWQTRIAAAEASLKDFLPDWQTSVDYRVMQVFQAAPGGTPSAAGEVDRVALAEDWSRTKQKQSQLSFQLPKIVATHGRPEDAPFAPHVTAAVNQVLHKSCKAHYMVDECLADVVNAAGIMVSKVGVEVILEEIPMPAPVGPPLPDGTPAPPQPPVLVRRVVGRRFSWNRKSPADFLFPQEFRASNWDDAPWLGTKALVPVETCKKHPVWGPVIEAAAQGGKQTPTLHDAPQDTLAKHVLTKTQAKAGTVPCYLVKEVYYRAAQFDRDALHPDHLRVFVTIEGLDDPVEHGDMDEQQWVPGTPEVPGTPATAPNPMTGAPATPATPGQPGRPGYFKGLTCFPLRVETLTYVSDLAIPPSDSRAGRAQVNELMRSRAQMLKQRDASVPIRWYDVNRVDEVIAQEIDKGDWQKLIPMNGPGDRAIGEVARANYPRENFQFQSILGRDLDGAWSLSSNQLAQLNGTERSATEIDAISNASQTRLNYEKARINRYISEGAAVLWALMQRYVTGPEFVEIVGANGAKVLAAMPTSAYSGSYNFDFVPDTSDHIDIQTRQANALRVFNLLANSPNVNRVALESEIFLLHGMDPAQYVKQAPPPEPPPANISYRFGGEDLLNPMAVAVMMKTEKLAPADIAAAAAMIQDALAHMVKVPPPGVADGTPTPSPAEPPAGPEPGRVEPPQEADHVLKRSATGERLLS